MQTFFPSYFNQRYGRLLGDPRSSVRYQRKIRDLNAGLLIGRSDESTQTHNNAAPTYDVVAPGRSLSSFVKYTQRVCPLARERNIAKLAFVCKWCELYGQACLHVH